MLRGLSNSQHNIMHQDTYKGQLLMTNQALVKEMINSAPPAEAEKFKKFWNNPERFVKAAERGTRDRELLAKKAALEAVKGVLKAGGMNTSLGYNFYDLRGPAYLIYPVNVPFRNSLARMSRVNDGWGTAANWKATRNPGSGYIGAVEGQRAALSTPDEHNYVASYKELGVERGATFTSQFAGEGYTDNVADEHLRGLHEFWLGEEGMMLLGNSGTASGNNGYALGTMNTPVGVNTPAKTGGFANDTNVSAFCVAITPMGNPNNAQYGYNVFPTVAGGLVPNYVRQNYDGTTTQVNCGTSIISAGSNVVACTTANSYATFTATPVRGAFAYAWFIDTTDASVPNLANAYLAAITTFPSLTIGAAPAGTQTGAAFNALGAGADFSYNPYDFDGLISYAVNAGYLIDGAGANLTKGVGGSVVELDADLEYLWSNFQAQPDCIWASVDAKLAIENTILASTNGLSAYRFDYSRDTQGEILGGFTVNAYKNKFTMNADGGNALPIRIHPMLPPGTIYYDISTNPYPHSRVPFVRGMYVQRDYYSIEWPLVTRQWTFGTYCHEVLAHTMPWLSAVRCGIGGAGS